MSPPFRSVGLPQPASDFRYPVEVTLTFITGVLAVNFGRLHPTFQGLREDLNFTSCVLKMSKSFLSIQNLVRQTQYISPGGEEGACNRVRKVPRDRGRTYKDKPRTRRRSHTCRRFLFT